MKKNRNLKKYIIIAAVFLTAMLSLVGRAMWLILTEVEQTLENLSTLDAMTIEYKPNKDTAMYYGDTNGYTATGEKVYYKIGNTQHEIEGTWLFDVDEDGVYESTIDSIMASANTAKDWFTVSTDGKYYNLILTRKAQFTLKDNTLNSFIFREDYVVPQVTLKVPMLVVAQCNSTYYTTIDSALAAAAKDTANNNTVTVLTGSSGNANAKKARTIGITATEGTSITIANGDTLLIPYDETFTDSPYYKTLTSDQGRLSCKNQVYLAGELINNGTLVVFGEITGDQIAGGANAVGGAGTSKTFGYYGMITCLDDNAYITSTGTIYCYGYIEGDVSLQSGATMQTMFSILEHRGGKRTSALILDKKSFPFRRYYIENVRGTITVNYGAFLYGFAVIDITIAVNAPVKFVGVDGEKEPGFLGLKEGSFAEFSYSTETKTNKINIYGSASLNTMSVTAQGMTISTKDNWVPISYLWEINLFPLDENTPATVSAGSTNNIAFLPGSKLTVHKGVTLNANQVAIYESCTELNQNLTDSVAYGNKDPAEFTVFGTFTAEAVGGPIIAGDSHASLQYSGNKVSYQEPISATTNFISASIDYTTVELFAKGRVVTGVSPLVASEIDNLASSGTYYSAACTNNLSAWYLSNFQVTLNANGGSVSPNTVSSTGALPGEGIKVENLPEPDRAYHTFDHWCTDPSCAGGDACPCPDVLYEGNITLTAIWQAHEFNIKYVITVDGQPTSESGTLTAAPFTIPSSDVANTALPEPDKTDRTGDGNIFIGWSVRSGAATDNFSFTPAYLVNGAVKNVDGIYERTIYGVWITKPHTLSFAFGNNPYNTQLQVTQVTDAAENYYPDTDQIIPADILNFDTNVEKSHYFSGWYAKDTNNEDVEYVQGVSKLSDFADADGNVTLYAMWDTKYTLTLEGSSGDTNQPNQKVDAQTYYFLESQLSEALFSFNSIYQTASQYNTDPTVSKYFDGWTDLPEEFDANKTKTFSANWNNKVKVTYDANEGTCGTTAHWYHDGTDLKLPTATRGEYYKFLGWYTAASDGSWIGNAGTSYAPDADITLYAHWQGYTVTYHANYGSVPSTSETYAGTALTLPSPTRDGYTFTGWYTAASGGELLGKSGDSYIPTTDIALYAHWKENLTVTYNANGGTCATTTASYTGTALTLPTATRDGYTFLGWYTAASGGTKIGDAGASYTPTDNITLYAHWIKHYTVTYDANGGKVSPNSETKNVGESFALPTPTLDGYRFLGWYTAASGGEKEGDAGASYTLTEDITLYAQWVKVYTIKVETSNATITGTSNGKTACFDETITVTVSFTYSNSTTLTVKDANGESILSESKAGTYTFKMPASDVTINASSTMPCFTADTLIILSDGTQKRIDELTFGDKILAWDFFTGTYVAKDISLLVYHGEALNRIANMVMADGTILRIVGEHGVFDYDLNKFVYITPDNVEEYVGHRFVQYNADGSYNIVELVEGYATEEYCGFYSISSSGTSNAFASGLLTVAPPDDFYNWIEMDGKLMYDVEQFQKDVETYGLYTYEDFKDYVTYEQFVDWNGAYLKIAVEKGYFTFDYILELIELYKGWMPSN